MSVLSLTTDLGSNNFGLSQLKANIAQRFSAIHMVDLFHHNEVYDIESMAYQVLGAMATFPKDSIHLVFSKFNSNKTDVLIAKIGTQFLIVPNNGIVSLLHILDYQAKVYSWKSRTENPTAMDIQNDFQDALDLVLGKSYANKLEETISFVQTKPFNTDLNFLEDKAICRVIHTDSIGNVVLNIREDEFKDYFKGSAFHILFLNIEIFQLSPNYSVAYNNNRIGALFNETGFLELFMIGGNLTKLFNINKWQNNKIEIIKDNDTNREINFQSGA